jgi:hypothetical protein
MVNGGEAILILSRPAMRFLQLDHESDFAFADADSKIFQQQIHVKSHRDNPYASICVSITSSLSLARRVVSFIGTDPSNKPPARDDENIPPPARIAPAQSPWPTRRERSGRLKLSRPIRVEGKNSKHET